MEAAKSSLVEKMILRYAKPFLEGIKLEVKLNAGEIILRDMRFRPNVIEAVEEFLIEQKADIYGQNGTPIVFPHGADCDGGTIREAKVHVPVPNPFNGEQWRITVDGVELQLRVLGESRRKHLLRRSKARATEAAERRATGAVSTAHSEAGSATPASGSTTPAQPVDHKDVKIGMQHHDDDHKELAQAAAEMLVEHGDSDEPEVTGTYTERLQKRIDRYFREHLEIKIMNVSIVIRNHDDALTPEVQWDVKLGCLSLDLGVGDIRLPDNLDAAMKAAPPSAHVSHAPHGIKVLEERTGLGFENLRLELRGAPDEKPCGVLHFPEKAFGLHVVKRTWEEHDPLRHNGTEKIHVDMPDKFKVEAHWAPSSLRGSLLRFLHAVFEGVAVSVPDFADLMTVHFPGGWHTNGTAMAVNDENPDQLGKEYMALWLKSHMDVSLATRPAHTLPNGHVGDNGVPGTDTSPQKNGYGGANPEIIGAVERTPRTPRTWGPMCCGGPVRCKPCPSCPPMHGICGEYGVNGHIETNANALTEAEQHRLQQIEMSKTSEWIAYMRRRCARNGSAALTGPEDQAVHPEDASPPPIASIPSFRWFVCPWRRFEVTLAFGASFEVGVSHGDNHHEVLHLDFPKNMAAVLIRDAPSEWYVWASLPGMSISTCDLQWLRIPKIMAELRWGRRDCLDPLEAQALPTDIASVCHVHANVGAPTIELCPLIAADLLPLLVEIPQVFSWPELRYFFGEWGYMPRPMAYIVDSVEVEAPKIVVVTRHPEERPMAASLQPDSHENAQITVAVGPVSVSSAALYLNNIWEPQGLLEISVGETKILSLVDAEPRHVLTLSNVNVMVACVNPAPGGIHVKVSLANMEIAISPQVLLCGVKLGSAYVKGLSPVVRSLGLKMPTVATAPVMPDWLWPFELTVLCAEPNPMQIALCDSVAPCMRITPSIALSFSIRHPKFHPDKPMVSLELGQHYEQKNKVVKTSVMIEYLDDQFSESWEPLLEPWEFQLQAELDGPPKSAIKVKLQPPEGDDQGAGRNPLNINVTPPLIRKSLALYRNFFPIVYLLIKEGPQSLVPQIWPSHIHTVNLAGSPVLAQVRTLPQSETEVALKLQSIFRGRKERRKLEKLRASGKPLFEQRDAATLISVKSDTPGSARGQSKSVQKTLGRNASLRSAVFEIKSSPKPLPLSVAPAQRLRVTFGKNPIRTLSSFNEAKGSRSLSSKQLLGPSSSSKTTGSKPTGGSTGGGGCGLFKRLFGGKKTAGSPQNRTAGSDETSPLNRGPSEMRIEQDATLMNVCRRGHTQMVSTHPLAHVAYVCEVVASSPSQRMLLIQSPIRIFNYTDRDLDLAFFGGEAPTRMDIPSDLPEKCTAPSTVIGAELPVDPQPYGFAPGNTDTGKASEPNTWKLPKGCFASVPPCLRLSSNTVQFKVRWSEASDQWPSDLYVPGNMENESVRYLNVQGSEKLRMYLHRRECTETSLVVGTGQRVVCADILVLPVFSISNALPIPIETEIVVKDSHGAQNKKKTLVIEAASSTHHYDFDVEGRKVDLSVRMAEYEDSSGKKLKYLSDWSHHVHDVCRPQPRFPSVPPEDEKTILKGAGGHAASELDIRRGDVCIISCPVWFRDWTALTNGLICTDAKGHPFPRAGAYFLLDSSLGDNYLKLTGEVAASDYQVAVSVEEAHKLSEQEAALKIQASFRAKQKTKDMKAGGESDAKPAPPKGHRASVVLPVRLAAGASAVVLKAPKSWKGPHAFPLCVESQPLREVFGSLGPPVQLLTAKPGLMLTSDVRTFVQQVGRPEIVSFQPGQSSPLWLWLDDWRIKVKPDDDDCQWSNEIKCTTTGIHSVAIETTRGSTRAIAVEISDAIRGIISISIRMTSPGLAVSNQAPSITTVHVETDSPVESPHTDSTPKSGPPPHCFVASHDNPAACGWFRPFAKNAHTHTVKLYLASADSAKVPAPIEVNLYDWAVYALLRPQGAHTSQSVPCIRKTQHSQFVRIQVVELKVGHDFVFTQEEVKGVCSECGHHIKRKALLEGLKDGCVKCDPQNNHPGCGTTLHIPAKVTAPSLVRDKIKNVTHALHTRQALHTLTGATDVSEHAQDYDGPLAYFMQIGKWIANTALTITLDVPQVGVSIMSKRKRQELLFVNVEGVFAMVEAPEGALHTHTYDLEVSEVRIDQQIGRDEQRPAIVSSTVVLKNAKNDRNENEQPPALAISVVRPFVTAPALCLKILSCKLEQRWEVVAETKFVNLMFEFAAECLHMIGPIRLLGIQHLLQEFEAASGSPTKSKSQNPMKSKIVKPQASKTQSLIDSGDSPSRAVMDLIEESADNRPAFHPPRAPLILQTDHVAISAIEAKIWTSLRLDQMSFVPPAIARTVQFITMSSAVELTAALVRLEQQELPPHRNSLMELVLIFVKIYTPQLIKTATRILGSSNLGGIAAVPFRLVRGAVGWAGDAALSAVTLGQRDQAKAKIRKKLGRMTPFADPDAINPALQGAPRQRMPRLLLANARVTNYDPLQAEILQKLGIRLSKDLLYSYELCSSPQRLLLVLTLTHLCVCQFLDGEEATGSTGKDKARASVAQGQGDKDPRGAKVKGRWHWCDVVDVDFTRNNGESVMQATVRSGGNEEKLSWPCGSLNAEQCITLSGTVRKLVQQLGSGIVR